MDYARHDPRYPCNNDAESRYASSGFQQTGKEEFLCANNGMCSRWQSLFVGALGGAMLAPQPAGAVSEK